VVGVDSIARVWTIVVRPRLRKPCRRRARFLLGSRADPSGGRGHPLSQESVDCRDGGTSAYRFTAISVLSSSNQFCTKWISRTGSRQRELTSGDYPASVSNGPNDGWAAFSTGTTGGAAADEDHVYLVTNRSELKAAVASLTGNPLRIIIVAGTIYASVNDGNQPLACSDYAAGDRVHP